MGGGERGERVHRISSINGRWKIDGEGKNSIENVEAKELYMYDHGHELKGRNVGGRGYAGPTGMNKGRKMGQL